MVKRGRSYWYWLAEVTTGEWLGPWAVTVADGKRAFLPAIGVH
jgi:hypothetical protein